MKHRNERTEAKGRGRLGRIMRRLAADRGAVSPLMALMLIPIIGALGMAAEAGGWYFTQRSAQNAADTAALAAAINGCTTGTCGSTYDKEARAAALKYGFQDGVDNATVTPAFPVTCPDGTVTCYRVTITKALPIYLVRVVGFTGDAASGTKQTIQAVAVARPKGAGETYCVTALGTADNAIEFKGAGGGGSEINFGGCSFYAPNGGASCTNKAGTTTNIQYADVKKTGDAKDCGTERPIDPSEPAFVDPYAALKSNIPAPGPACPSGYPQAPSNGANKDKVTTAENLLSGELTFSATSAKCGDVKLTGDVTVTADSVLVINNGRLDLAGHKLSTADGVHLTIIFSGTSTPATRHYPMSSVNGGTLDYTAPQAGTWKGVAIYQNPDLTTGVDMTYAGNNPDLNISGLIYSPNGNIQISGSIDHATAGDACLAFFGKTVSSNGTVAIFADPTRECDRFGLLLPTVPGTESRQALVQ